MKAQPFGATCFYGPSDEAWQQGARQNIGLMATKGDKPDADR